MNSKNFVRLTVFDSKSGLAVFDYHQSSNDDIFDEDMFAGVVHAISIILQESANLGYVKQIQLKDGYLLVKRNFTHNLTFVLVGRESKLFLKRKLNEFERLYFKKFYGYVHNSYENPMIYNTHNEIFSLAENTF